jgi:DNA helicase-2/ATP-dependent DNA helicase PcrA
MSIYDTLNPRQKEAVEHHKGPLLILAGAGSGKTRVLTHRIAYLMEKYDVSPWHILAITFTNKAAQEMRERVNDIVGYGADHIWVKTFHSTCFRILKQWIDRLGYNKDFTVYDTDDQKTLIREVCKYLDIDTKVTKERALMSVISDAKDKLISPEEYAKGAQGDYQKEKYARVYSEYQLRLKSNNALDFDDLIFKTVELLKTDKEVRHFYQDRFRYILVDEYQDTNYAQFVLVKTLADGINEYGEKEHNLCVVGDDDQSIYKFRGANIYNILNFEQEYPNAKVIKLEQNYRSSQSILDVANTVIKNNIGRKEKALWTDNPKGSPVTFVTFESDYDEAEGVAKSISDMVSSDSANYRDFAILYRTNAQFRVFEEKLLARNIPHKIVGGQPFYSRKEIKDIIAYLRTIANGSDSLSVRRIINVPKRGIGLASVDKVANYAIDNNISFYEALKDADHVPRLGRASSKILSFVSLIEVLKSKLDNVNYSLLDLFDELMEATAYEESLDDSDSIIYQDRLDNIGEFRSKIASYLESSDEPPTLQGFLEEVALVADIDNLDENADAVVLMTLHSSKGLEFPYVYMCGMEEGLFPSHMAIYSEDPDAQIEEERRLCYVGITRAQKHLTLTAAYKRLLRGNYQLNSPSRFIDEIPEELLNIENTSRYRNTYIPNAQNAEGKANLQGNFRPNTLKNPYSTKPRDFGGSKLESLSYEVGDSVEHQRFGIGTVLNINAAGRDYEVTVEFPKSGTKKMMASFAKMKKVN